LKILRIEIEEFGNLRNRSFDFDEAINLIRGDNESGKSTLMLFIRSMLYGIQKKQRGASLSDADRALSWDRDVAIGSMTVLHEGRLYRIERRIGRMARSLSDRLQVFDCESGTICTEISSPGEYFLGMPAEVFDSSCGIAQLGSSSIKGESVASAVQNLASNADETINTEKILKTLDTLRTKYLHKNRKGGSIYELDTKRVLLREQYAKAVNDNAETERLETINGDLKIKIAEVSEKKNTADELFSKVNLITVVRLFDKLHAFEAARDALEAKITSLKEENTKKSYLPDRKYLSELRGAISLSELAADDVEKEKARLAEKRASVGETDNELLKKYEKIEALGGTEAVRSTVKKHRSRTKLFLVLAVITALFSGVAAVFFLPAISALFIAFLFGALAISSAAKLKSYCKDLVPKPTEIEALIVAYEQHLTAAAEHRSELDTISANLAIKERIQKDALEKLSAILSVYKAPNDDIPFLAKNTADEISEFLDALDTLEASLFSQKEKIEGLSADLREYNEHKIRGKLSDELLAMSDEEMQTIKREKNYYEVQLKALEDKKHMIERTLLERKYSTKNPFEIAEELERVTSELERQEEQYSVIMLTIESITQATANMRNTLTPRLRKLTSDYISELTDDKYNTLSITDSLDVSVSAEGFSRPLDAFSTGTRDLTYLALRLSLLKILSEDTLPPIFMDETLAMIDDTRATAVLELLSEYCAEGGQCILFSCHKREEELCRAAEIQHKSIEL